MAKKSKSAAPAKSAAPVEKKSNRRKKKGADAPLLNGDAPEAVEEPAVPEVVEAPPAEEAPVENNGKKGKRGKKKKSEEPAPEPEASAEPEPTVEEVPTETANAEALVAETAAEPPPAAVIDWDELARTVEALLFAAEEPLQARELGRCSGSDSATIRKLIPRIREKYDVERRPWDILETGTGWRMVTRPEFYPAIQRLKTQTMQRKLTQAGLETLALIAYRQPISRAEVENVRGVGAGPVLRQLLERKLIKISGRGTGLGQPLLYGTTDYFLEHFGLKALQDLPKPGEFKQ